MNIFKDRSDAGRQLAISLCKYKNQNDLIILALPRGGVPVAYEIAQAIHVPMTVFLVHKLAVPNHKEVAMGAVAEGDICILNQPLIKHLGITKQQIQKEQAKKSQELNRRLQHYRHNKNLPNLGNMTVILVDDGIATGATCRAAIQAIQLQKPKKLILATPVASKESLHELSLLVDEMICLSTPIPFYSVGQWYQHFDQTTDAEVLKLLQAISSEIPLSKIKA